MFPTRTLSRITLSILLVGLCAWMAMAQDAAPEGGRRDRQAQGDRQGGQDRAAEFRQRMFDQLKETLGASDEEWKELQPRVEKVMNLQMQARAGGGRGMFMGGGRNRQGDGAAGGPPGGNGPQTEVGKATADLRAALEDKAAAPDALKARLEALRAARGKAREELAKAQQELREVLTLRQEAQLVMNGMLD